jgi:hypothetical protein
LPVVSHLLTSALPWLRSNESSHPLDRSRAVKKRRKEILLIRD